MIAKFFTNIRRTHSATRGFTLIETLVAVIILATAIAGPLSIASRSLNNSLVAKEQITAFFLAQDAVEYVRFVRDTNTLKGADWITGSGTTTAIDLTPCTNANGCQVDTTSNTPNEIPTVCPSTCDRLNYDATNMRYTYAATSGSVTKSAFTRKIALTSISTTEYKLTVTVSWQDLGGVTRQVSVYENIYKWQ